MKMQMELSQNSKKLIDHLRSAKTGEVFTYADLTKLIGEDVTKTARGALHRAREVLLREGIRFDVIRGTGIVHMTDAQVAQSGSRSIRLVGRTARREVRRVSAVKDFDALSNEDKIQVNATQSVLGAVAHFARPTQIRILEAAVAEAHRMLPPAGSVETIFRALSGKKQ